MFVLDTDHLSIIQRRSNPAYSRICARLQGVSSREAYTTIVSFEEQMRGWLAVIGGFRRSGQEVAPYRQLHRLLSFFSEIPVLDFDDAAAEKLAQLRSAKVRVGSMDLKIAAITLVHGAVLLSRNLGDFRRVPDLEVEDWTQ